jgi:hypothetical protein
MVGESSAIRHPSSTDSGFCVSLIDLDGQFEIAGDTRKVLSRRGSQLAAAGHSFASVSSQLRPDRRFRVHLAHAVEMAVLRLRTALGDRNIVETIVKRGYPLAIDELTEIPASVP